LHQKYPRKKFSAQQRKDVKGPRVTKKRSLGVGKELGREKQRWGFKSQCKGWGPGKKEGGNLNYGDRRAQQVRGGQKR